MSDLPKTIGRFEIQSELGYGDLSVVYRAAAPGGRDVAVKTLRPGVFVSSELSGWRARFQEGLELARKLDHPHVARLLEASFDGEAPIQVVELVPAEALSGIIRRNALTVPQKMQLAVQIADALAYAHALGVTHHALKPGNVLVTRDGIVKVTDFALSRLAIPVTQSTSPPTRPVPHYRSPEQIFGQRADQRTDVFSFGIVLYELLFGRQPFEGDSAIRVTRKILNTEPPLLARAGDTLPEAIVALLKRTLAKNPIERYQGGQELYKDVAALADGLPAVDPAPAPASSDARPPRLLVEEEDLKKVVPIVKPVFSIGRRGDNDLVLNDEQVSRKHARIVREGDNFVIEDLSSRHGTFLNGQPVARAMLQSGDRLLVGKARQFRISFFLPGDIEVTSSSEEGSLGLGHASDRSLELLLDVISALPSSLDVDHVLNIIMDSALELTEAERGFLMLRDSERGFARRIARSISEGDMDPEETRLSSSVVERCIQTRQPVAVHNVDEVEELCQRASIQDLELKSITCVPLMTKGEVIGVLYLDSRKIGRMSGSHLELIAAFAAQASVSLENARLYELATHDTLTRLFLRRHFENRLREELQRAVRHGRPLSLLFLDVDFFKSVNDRFGHLTGDAVLRGVAATLIAQARISDLPARYGGEEFVVLAPETRIEDALILAERIRERVKATSFSHDGAPFTVTVSVGVAELQTGTMTDAETLVKAADTAMYQAKTQGRDRVCLA